MPAMSSVLWAATLTLLMGLFYFYTAMRVGVMRGRYNIKAPATSGHPQFDRAYRVQLNTLEQLGIILPFLWVAALYPVNPQWLAPLTGVIWLLGRVIYLRTYMADPDKRVLGAGIGGFTNVVMFVIALYGVLRAWFAGRA